MNPDALIAKFEQHSATVGVIGLGYVGLPLVMEFCRAGFQVIGFDVDKDKTDSLNSGESYIRHIASDDVKAMVDTGRLNATEDFGRIVEADAILICVPTPLTDDNEPDLSYIVSTGESIVPHLRPGQLIVLESTTYPGTTNEVLKVVLEKSGLKAGEDFLLAYSPEREDPGNPTYSTGKIPKVVGGCDDNALDAADALYTQIVVKTIRVSSADTAEAVKLLENIFRSVNIALANELKMIYGEMGIDIWEVIEAASTKPFGYMPFYPGPGLGGHCIPIDPFYLTWKAKEYGIATRFIELAGGINTAMPDFVIANLEKALAERGTALEKASVLVLGAAYKKDVADPRESPGITLMGLLLDKGTQVDYNDPYIPTLPKQRKHNFHLDSVELTDESLAQYDAILIATAHSCYDYDTIVRHAKLVVDSRNATKDVTEGRDKIIKT